MKRSGLVLSLALLALLQAAQPVVEVDASAGKPLNRFVFGHNIESGDPRGLFSPLAGPVPEHISHGQGFWNPENRSFYPAPLEQLKKVKPTMLRYPGGCLAHNFDWRKLTGPLSERPAGYNFGVDEFLQLCREVGAEPLMMIPDYTLSAEELPAHAAAFVEYLNAPAVPEHSQAMRRARAGHPEPYAVRYFELGNESDHGNHRAEPTRKFTTEEYISYFKRVSAAMKKVDPSIRVMPLTAPGHPAESDWNTPVYRALTDGSDFLVVHYYVAPLWRFQNPADGVAVAMASADQLASRLAEFRAAQKKHGGRVLPLAITEYNVACGREDSKLQRRFSQLAGLCNADLIRLFLEPETGVEIANYWHIAKGYFGAYSMAGNNVVRRGPLAFFELWGAHEGDTVLPLTIRNVPTGEFRLAGGGLAQAAGDRFIKGKSLTPEIPKFNSPVFQRYPDCRFTDVAPGTFTLDLGKVRKTHYIDFGLWKRGSQDIVSVKLSFEARFLPGSANDADGEIGLGLCDGRGWETAPLAIGVPGAEKTRAWQPFEGEIKLWHDTRELKLVLRLEPLKSFNAAGGLAYKPTGKEKSGAFDGKLEVRKLQLEAVTADIVPATRLLSGHASLADGGRTMHLVLFNKAAGQTYPVTVKLHDFQAARASGERLVIQDPYSTKYLQAEPVTLKNPGSEFELELPPLSMTALRLEK